MSYATIMEIISSDHFRQVMLDGLLFTVFALIMVIGGMFIIMREKDRQIRELQNMVDYYYNEESLNIK